MQFFSIEIYFRRQQRNTHKYQRVEREEKAPKKESENGKLEVCVYVCALKDGETLK